MSLNHNLKEQFVFNEENLKNAARILKCYPDDKKRSALMPLLELAQRQNDNWLSKAAMEYIADFLSLHYMQILEVATFYTMFNLKPVGKYHIQICTTTPCWLRGSDQIVKACEQELDIKFGEITADKKFSLSEVECLGACVNAPVVQINDDYHEDLSATDIQKLIKKL